MDFVIPSVFNLREFGFTDTGDEPAFLPSTKLPRLDTRNKPPRIKRELKIVEIRTVTQLTPRQHDLYRRLYFFYGGTNYIAHYLLPLRNKNNVAGCLSLRTVNYLVTNYAHTHPVRYVVEGILMDVAASYDSELLQHTKKLFDPFRRHWRIWWELPSGEQILTTLAQLNFFRWAIKCKILEWADEHRQEIEADMRQAQSRATKKKSCPPPS